MAAHRSIAVLVLMAVLLTIALGPLAVAAEDSTTPGPAVLFVSTTNHLVSDVADSMRLRTARLLSWSQQKLAGSSSSSGRKLRGINKIQLACNPRYSKWC
jgi:hypothetical protein